MQGDIETAFGRRGDRVEQRDLDSIKSKTAFRSIQRLRQRGDFRGRETSQIFLWQGDRVRQTHTRRDRKRDQENRESRRKENFRRQKTQYDKGRDFRGIQTQQDIEKLERGDKVIQ